MSKKFPILIGSIIIVLVIGLLLFMYFNRTTDTAVEEEQVSSEQVNEEMDTIITDRDTGESYDPEAPKLSTGWTDPRTSKVELFGTNELSETLYEKRSRIGSLLDDIKNSLYLYSEERLNNTYVSLSIIPSSITITENTVRGEVRLGQTDATTLFNAEILSTNTGEVHASITLGEKLKQYGGTFYYLSRLQGVSTSTFSIKQKDTHTPAIEVSGNKGAALSYLSSIGYKTPDLVVSFTDYRSPFE